MVFTFGRISFLFLFRKIFQECTREITSKLPVTQYDCNATRLIGGTIQNVAHTPIDCRRIASDESEVGAIG